MWIGLIGLGRVLLEQGEPDQSLVQFRQALSIDPQSVAAHRFLGKALLKNDEPHEAAAAYRRAVDLQPGDVVLRYELAQALEAEGKRREAVTELRRILELPPPADGNAVHSLAEAGLHRLGASP